jgi:hypothetical protein
MVDHHLAPADGLHLLDRVIWEALTGPQQRRFGLGGRLACRYQPDVAPFAAIANECQESYEALGSLLTPGDRLALFTPEPVSPPSDFIVVKRDRIDQMVLESQAISRGAMELSFLRADDVPAMLNW